MDFMDFSEESLRSEAIGLLVPGKMIEPLVDFVRNGGSFNRLVLSLAKDRLRSAVVLCQAHGIDLRDLPSITNWFQYHTPMNCCGSDDNVEAWNISGGQAGIEARGEGEKGEGSD